MARVSVCLPVCLSAGGFQSAPAGGQASQQAHLRIFYPLVSFRQTKGKATQEDVPRESFYARA